MTKVLVSRTLRACARAWEDEEVRYPHQTGFGSFEERKFRHGFHAGVRYAWRIALPFLAVMTAALICLVVIAA